MAIAEPWQIAEIPGPKKAAIISRAEVIDAIKRSKRPVMIVGHQAVEIRTNDRNMIDDLIDLGKIRRIPIIATGGANRALLKRGYTQATIMTAVDAGHRLSDREWKGLDGKGPYDLAIFAGLPHYMEWTIRSGLRHFAPHVKTVSLKCCGRYYPGLSTLPHISGPCPWTACISPVQAFRSLIFRPGREEKSERSHKASGG
jgi:acetyl-CoA decarbonylase/synthase complex subunit epsilon